MNGQEIRERIDKNNAQIQKALNKFILTDEINKLMEDNVHLRAMCKHEYVNGACRFCDVPIDFAEDMK